MMETLRSSESSVLTRAVRRNSPEEGNVHIHGRENRKSLHVKKARSDALTTVTAKSITRGTLHVEGYEVIVHESK
jgi:hypothetical protein